MVGDLFDLVEPVGPEPVAVVDEVVDEVVVDEVVVAAAAAVRAREAAAFTWACLAPLYDR